MKLYKHTNQIFGNTFIEFTFTNVELRTLHQIHKEVVIFDGDTHQSLDNVRIVNDGQFVNFFSVVI